MDRDGHYVVLEDETRTINLQLKTIFKSSTKRWEIRKRLLRPEVHYMKTFGIALKENESPGITEITNEGLQGGVVLIEPIEDGGELKDIRYFYSDIYVIAAISAGLVPGKAKTTSDAATRLIENLKTGSGSDVLWVKRLCLSVLRMQKVCLR